MGFWNRLLGRERPSEWVGTPAHAAKQRLQVVLVQDRVNLPPAVMDAIRTELVAVISKYVEIEPEGVEFNLTKGEKFDKLTANIPVKRART
jgi:cell division topological specificity factor